MAHKIKIASQNDIESVMHSALSAVDIQYVQKGNRPHFVSGESECYLINQSGPYWKHILEEQTICLFVHEDVKDSVFEIIASRDASS